VDRYRIHHSQFVPLISPQREGGQTDKGEGGQAKAPVRQRPRFFTVRECARLMGFPDAFDLTGNRNPERAYHQLGNAVVPPVIAAIGRAIVAAWHAE
jgi:site-specific DNA-cytosine methylase